MENIEKYIAIVDEQEQTLRFDHLTNTDAFELGLIVIDQCKTGYSQPVSVRIDIDNVTVFYHLMDGTDLNNDWWMKKKLNGTLKTGRSSFMNFLTIRANGRWDDFPWSKDDGNFAVVGGCFPLRIKNGELRGHLMVSGLVHQEDHQIMADSLATLLHVKIPTILDGGSFEAKKYE